MYVCIHCSPKGPKVPCSRVISGAKTTLPIGDDSKTASSIGNDAKRCLQLRSPTTLRAASQEGLQQRLKMALLTGT